MTGRNGEHVEQRLRRCSLYEPACDLAVVAPDGSVAGYALFWPDPVTGVGLVEPMRVEAGHGGQGLAKALLREGLDRLARRGCRQLKVSHDDANPTARAVYLGAGFEPFRRETVYVRRAASSAA